MKEEIKEEPKEDIKEDIKESIKDRPEPAGQFLSSRGKKKGGKRERKKSGIAALAVVLVVVLGYVVWLQIRLQNKPQSRYELERNALEGFLPGRSDSDIQSELNRIIENSRLNISMNPTPLLKEGKLNVMIENVPANNYYLQVDVFIYTDEETGEREKIYESGIIRQGYYVEEGESLKKLEEGSYNGIAVFTALYPETLEEIGQVGMNLVVTVQ